MEHGTVFNNTLDELAAKNRLESFKLGKGVSSVAAQKPSHGRSHSRNNSSISSFPLSLSIKSLNVADTPAPISPPPTKRNSHHKRRSSVSTRIESAEMMGVPIPDLPPSTSEDNINLGEKDSIRRRALWALEGKQDVAFSKVQIPELSTPVMEKMMFDLTTKPPQPQNTVPSYGANINTLMANKRDSFKLLGTSSSSKDQLHTLVEEEEEEEEEAASAHHEVETNPKVTPEISVASAVEVTAVISSRSRPANPNLRPLSLTPDNLASNTTGLSTPSDTSISRLGLKTLALVPSGDDSANVTKDRPSAPPTPLPHRPPLTLKLALDDASPTPLKVENAHRCSSISYKSSIHNEGVVTNYGLPTPDTATHPTFDRRFSISDAFRSRGSSSSSTPSSDEDPFSNQSTQPRPLSASEQHFLFKSHNALLARIQDLERALSMKRMSYSGTSTAGSSRPDSIASDLTSDIGSNGEPSDEMLRLVADLKAERDELKRDVEGWRTRVADMVKQQNVLAGRVESERRDAWIARSMSGLLEVEKVTLERKLASVDKNLLELEADKKTLELENVKAKERIASLEAELERIKRNLEEERKSKSLSTQEILATPTPQFPESRSRPVGFIAKRFTSVDSDVTEVDEEINQKFNFSLKSVSEDEEEVTSEEDNGLAGYEDEEESDVTFQSSSSFGSEDELPRPVVHLQDVPISVTPRSDPSFDDTTRHTHVKRPSLSKAWTFPTSAIPGKQVIQVEPEVDRFFGCLEDNSDHECNDSVPNSPSAYSYEKSKNLFASGFKYDASDAESPFFFPLDGVEVESPKTLEVVHEEEEEEEEEKVQAYEDMFGEAGGIQITFTPPEADEDQSLDSQCLPSPSPVKPPIPTIQFFDFDEDTSVSFNFGRPLSHVQEESVDNVFSSSPLTSKSSNVGQVAVEHVIDISDPMPSMITPPSSLPRPTSPQPSPPSSIPRAKVVKPVPFTEFSASTPPRPLQSRIVSDPNNASNSYVTPPSRRGGKTASLIPQAISSPSPLRSASIGGKPKANMALSSTFIRQPQRKPLMLASNNTKSEKTSSVSHVNDVMNTHFSPRSLKPHGAHIARNPHTEMKSIDLPSDHFVINATNISASTTATTTPSQLYPRNCSSTETSAAPSVGAPLSIPSFSSIMTSPLSSRISFPSFTNLIPLSWSQRKIALEASNDVVENTHKADDGVLASQEVAQSIAHSKRGFVTKERQLEKLRCRMERENPAKARSSISIWCKKCDNDDDVVL